MLLPLFAANVAAWTVAFGVFHGSTVLLGAAFLAYSLGCRHALDADHIAAIDNATRRLAGRGSEPATTGLWFSLGHSAVVWLGSIGIALVAQVTGPHLAPLRHIGNGLGTAISALFLLGIAAANAAVLGGIVSAIRRHRRGECVEAATIASLFKPKGLYARLLLPVFRMVSRSRHMFVVGALFGLGFDTASEVALLGLSAAAASGGTSIWSILILPALFTAGMSLLDTIDSVLMARAYGWAAAGPARRLYYNLTITFASVIVALVVGLVELASLRGLALWVSVGLLAALLGWLARAAPARG